MTQLSPEVLAFARLIQDRLDEEQRHGEEWSRDDVLQRLGLARQALIDLNADTIALTRAPATARHHAGVVGLQLLRALQAARVLEGQ
ncbi:MAG TPA: hypothetical protein VFH78_08640 [Candidatus Thermoplasmatota archaeon]|nr:hypothetical protein [Candidatus Thermoplasmatota archaeon]